MGVSNAEGQTLQWGACSLEQPGCSSIKNQHCPRLNLAHHVKYVSVGGARWGVPLRDRSPVAVPALVLLPPQPGPQYQLHMGSRITAPPFPSLPSVQPLPLASCSHPTSSPLSFHILSPLTPTCFHHRREAARVPFSALLQGVMQGRQCSLAQTVPHPSAYKQTDMYRSVCTSTCVMWVQPVQVSGSRRSTQP